MKRMLFAVIAVLLAISLPGWAGMEAAARDKEFIRIAGGSTGATFHIMASGICMLLNANVPWIDATPEPGGSVMNARRIGTQKLKMGMLTTDTAYHAINGGPEFKNERYPDLRAVFSGHVSYWHMVTLERTGIKTIQDLKGRKVALGYPGGSVEIVTREILAEYGLLPDRDFKKVFLTHSEVVDALKDETIEAGAILTGAPSGNVLDLAATHKVRILPVSPDMQDKIIKKFPYYLRGVYKPGMYPGITENVPALTIGSYLTTNKSADDELVYLTAKLIGENTKKLAEMHPSGLEWSLETVKKGFVIPVHPGAMKYFKEKGIPVN